MNRVRKNLCLAFTLLLLILAGCSQDSKRKVEAADNPNSTKSTDLSFSLNPAFIVSQNKNELVFKDPLGDSVTLKKHPKRVVCLLASFLDLWYYSGGTAIASVTSKSYPLPEAAKKIRNLGRINKVSPEILLSLKPDLVIMTSEMQNQVNLKSLFKENNIPYLFLNYTSYQDFLNIMALMADLNGTEKAVTVKAKKITDTVDSYIAKAEKQKSPKVLILFTTTQSVTCELPSGTTGNIVKLLNGNNIADSSKIKTGTKASFSLERIVVENPDIIFIKTMGDVAECKANFQSIIKNNPAWGDLRAVKEGKCYYLPKDLFVYKPNEKFPKAFKIIYSYMYGEKQGSE